MSRPNNLLMIVFAMFAFRFGFAHTIAPEDFTQWMQFLGMMITIVLLTAGGNFINDYFDVRVDRINKPNAVYVETQVKRRVVILAHIVTTTLGILISFFVGKSMHSYLPFVVAIVVSIALGLYTPFFKKRVLSGNLLVSLCIGMIPLWSVWPHLSNLHIGFWTLIFSVFAFSVNFSREIVKDIEDVDGDAAENYKTLPVVMGTQTARIYALLFLFAALITAGVTLFIAATQHHSLGTLYLIGMGMCLPLTVALFAVFMANSKEGFHKASLILKIAMAVGITCGFVLRFV
ncbi:MAG: geranylgeranylglycerol-phosphate geranylgeranyltransferase [Flavobacteriales bacterium]|nr:geranylgeranylglycerol-phosphate geranylgeranyltransferase [Flavobacteriales bacterium]MDP4730874.1 geranylgeranylglycerol-phosphate geranylgeranyltransferase [Flavobacteriales bacterium]MDP4817842.1 geranylgeranylglycerol-phosphate geranylgeranyltransferase [Flavobacteriales bacterium]